MNQSADASETFCLLSRLLYGTFNVINGRVDVVASDLKLRLLRAHGLEVKVLKIK